WHHRSVFTLINDADQLSVDVHALIAWAYEILDLSGHHGVHPRFGVVDVVPYVALTPSESPISEALRDETARWISTTYDVPTFLYGPVANGVQRTLPYVRAQAFEELSPDFGPSSLSPRWGAVAVGARPVLVAWNLWLRATSIEQARALARLVRGVAVRSLAFEVGDQVQVSCNLIDVETVRPSQVYDRVQSMLEGAQSISHAELVGLAPLSLLEREDPARWTQLGLDPTTTIERRLEPLNPPGNDVR
ncbi:MAG: hypothetical protein HIU84_05025, partial [Acidobacteria bacterium]|nr:hypothetical protein [Acidobacteriota bacterium]